MVQISMAMATPATPGPGRREEMMAKEGIPRDWGGSVVWVPSRKAKTRRFDSWSGHMPGLWVRS